MRRSGLRRFALVRRSIAASTSPFSTSAAAASSGGSTGARRHSFLTGQSYPATDAPFIVVGTSSHVTQLSSRPYGDDGEHGTPTRALPDVAPARAHAHAVLATRHRLEQRPQEDRR